MPRFMDMNRVDNVYLVLTMEQASRTGAYDIEGGLD